MYTNNPKLAANHTIPCWSILKIGNLQMICAKFVYLYFVYLFLQTIFVFLLLNCHVFFL